MNKIIYLLTDKLVKMHVLMIFITGDICPFSLASFTDEQRWRRGLKARGQGHQKNPRPRTALPRTDPLEAKNRNARGQGQVPRTQPQVFSKEKKKVFTKICQAISRKQRLPKNFSGAPQNFNNSKNSAVLNLRTGQFLRT